MRDYSGFTPPVVFMHKELADGRWAQMSLADQMVNIGSEISRANRWRAKGNDEQCRNAIYRALELLSLTIDAQAEHHSLKEFCRLYEFIAGYYLYNENPYNLSGEYFQHYFDSFFNASSRAKQ